MQLFQGHTSSETERTIDQPASGRAAAMSEDSHQPADSQQQWLPLRQMSVPPQMLAHSAPSTAAAASRAVAAPADSTCTLPAASQLPGSAASSVAAGQPSEVSARASSVGPPSVLQQESRQGAVNQGTAAGSPFADVAASVRSSSSAPQSPSSPPQQAGLTPFEMAAHGSPFSARAASPAGRRARRLRGCCPPRARPGVASGPGAARWPRWGG